MYMCGTITIEIGGHCLNTFQSGAMATTFDVGGMIGTVSVEVLMILTISNIQVVLEQDYYQIY